MIRGGTKSGLFFREFLRNFRTTGAVLPSGRKLAVALTRFLDGPHPQPRKILEVGPGTGAVTCRIIERMGESDSLDLVELNEAFVRCLERRFLQDPDFKAVFPRTRIWHCPVEQLPSGGQYHFIVSGLPLNNFSPAEVEHILSLLINMLLPGGVLSFFEYIAVRPLHALVSRRRERARLRGIGQVMHATRERYEVRRDAVWLNIPPAWVHHLRRG